MTEADRERLSNAACLLRDAARDLSAAAQVGNKCAMEALVTECLSRAKDVHHAWWAPVTRPLTTTTYETLTDANDALGTLGPEDES